MAISTNLISGLSSGFDWRSMIDQLIAIEHQRVELVEDQKSEYESKLAEWQSFNTTLLALKTAAGNLKDADDFALYTSTMSTSSSTVDGSDLLSVSTDSYASVGSYSLKIQQLATADKLSSQSFSSYSESLGSGYAGDIIINGTVISITETDDLADIRDRINNANSGTNPTGVTASIVSYGTGNYRLTLTSDATGTDGISILNGSATDILSSLGFTDSSRTVKNHIAGGDKSDAFTSSTVAIKSLLGLSTTQSSEAGNIIINGQAIDAIDLSSDTLESIKDKFVAAGIDASIISETADNQVSYRILVEGSSNTYTDSSNILETLGILKGGVSSVMGVTGDISNTSAGEYITSDTLIKDIDGYTDHQTDDYILFSGTDTDGIAVNDSSFLITDSVTVQDLLTKIEELYGDVTASVTSDGKIMVTDNTTGTSTLAVQIALKNADTSDDDTLTFATGDDLGTAAELRKRQLVEGQDATILLDGIEVTSSSNTVTDVIGGVTLNLLQADQDTTITLNIEHDIDTIMDNISTFVDSYNEVASYISQQQSYDAEEEETGGILFGDGTLSSVKTDLASTLLQTVWGVSTEFSILGLVGINLENDGTLSIDSDTLRGYLTTNFNDVKALFAANGSTSSGTLEYISHSGDTQAGDYTVHITQAATQASETGTTDLSGGLSGDESLTITENDKTATFALTNGMSLAAIVNEINTELDTVYTESHAGANILYEGSGESQVITSATTWNQVYVGANAAALVNDDEIHFEGTTRSGAEVSGYYKIYNTATNTVQGLLSAIETAYNNEVRASINDEGKILITDKYSGNSSLTITFDYSLAHDLDFGTVSTENDGGQEGRYAIPITASDDGSGHLVLTHDSYGSDKSFTISATGNLGLTNDTFSGLDVAGTINGEAATGSGQILTGNSDETNIDGLVIKYTGSSEDLDVGTVGLTLGTAELFDRVLYNITDPYEGYVSYKQDSLTSSIDRYEDRIAQMETLLNQKMESMINRFVIMEVALSQIQAQSDWLTGQVNSSMSAWNW